MVPGLLQPADWSIAETLRSLEPTFGLYPYLTEPGLGVNEGFHIREFSKPPISIPLRPDFKRC